MHPAIQDKYSQPSGDAEPTALTRLDSLAERLEGWITRYPWLAIAALTAVYAIWVIGKASTKPFWFDEIYTILGSRLSPSELWRALSQALDLNPPGFYLITKAAHSLFGGPGWIVTRLSSMIAFWLAGLSLGWLVARRCGPLLGVFAALVLTLTPAILYAFEARAFAVVVACCAAGIVCWTSAETNRWAPAGLGLAIALAVSVHYYAVLIGIAFGAAELVYTFRHRRLRVSVWAAMILGVAPLLAYVPLIRSASTYFKGFVGKPEKVILSDLYDVFFSGSTLFLFPVLLVGVALADRKGISSDKEPKPIAPEELVLFAVLLLLPAICWTVSKVVVGQVQLRYALSASLGFAALMAYLLHLARIRKGIVLLLLMAVGGHASYRAAGAALGVLRHKEQQDPRVMNPKELDKLAGTSNKPIVLARCLQMVEMHALDASHIPPNMVCLADPVKAYEISRINSVDLAVTTLNQWFPFPLRKPDEYVANHREFLLYGTVGESAWIKEYLRRKGARFQLVKSDLEDELYDVSLP